MVSFTFDSFQKPGFSLVFSQISVGNKCANWAEIWKSLLIAPKSPLNIGYEDIDKSPLDNGGIKCADFKVLKKIFVISFFQSFMQFPSSNVTLHPTLCVWSCVSIGFQHTWTDFHFGGLLKKSYAWSLSISGFFFLAIPIQKRPILELILNLFNRPRFQTNIRKKFTNSVS